jgi:hypothetical protein
VTTLPVLIRIDAAWSLASKSLGLALLDGRLEVRLGVGELALLGARLDELEQRRLVPRIELEDLAVAGRGLGLDAVLQEVVADAHELRDGLRGLAGPPVEVAERGGGGGVVGKGIHDALVFGDRAIQPPLAEQLLGFPKRVVSIDGHSSLSRVRSGAGHSMVSNSVGV